MAACTPISTAAPMEESINTSSYKLVAMSSEVVFKASDSFVGTSIGCLLVTGVPGCAFPCPC
ncbi:hypothetical protein TIFTF001_045199 [Ficus carica]|uniref:Uncharacterized protein n=1 Tax=Ficus carica TaxID=3494 RepID=A0AA87Z7M6_FICCA|nr:hypothetical protein TIFTF001_045199 [Ficus carica]